MLVRHGQSEANAIGLLVGRTDSPLSELGQLQAAAIAGALASRGTSTARILTSPLQRADEHRRGDRGCLRPSGRAREGPAVDLDERFVELDYGELDGTCHPTCRPRSGTTGAPRSPGVRQAARPSRRFEPEWAPPARSSRPKRPARDVVVVTHLSPVRAAVTWALGGGPEMSWRLSLGVASITRISTGDPLGPVLVGFNDRAHLSGLG